MSCTEGRTHAKTFLQRFWKWFPSWEVSKMISFKLIFRNVHKNIRDYLIYFPYTDAFGQSVLCLQLNFRSASFFLILGITGSLLYDQLGILLSALSVVIAVVLAFLIIYANQFLLKRRKKEFGRIYGARHAKKDAFPGCLPVKLFVLVSLLWFQVWFLGCSFRKDFLWLH